MAIERSVIRYLPYEAGDTDGKIGISRYALVDGGVLATAVYPGRSAYTSLAHVAYAGSCSSIDMDGAGLTGGVREWEFTPLAANGVTLAPLTTDVTSLIIGLGGDSDPPYAGGVIEVGVYVSGQYAVVGALSLGTPFDIGWLWNGAHTVRLDWSDLPGAPAFWTDVRGAYEV